MNSTDSRPRVSVFGGPTTLRVGMETTRPNLAPALRLLGEVLREPAFDAKEFDELQQENLAGIEENVRPDGPRSNAYQRYLNPDPKGDPRYASTIDEQVADYTGGHVSTMCAASTPSSTAPPMGSWRWSETSTGPSSTALATELFGAWKSSAAVRADPDGVSGT